MIGIIAFAFVLGVLVGCLIGHVWSRQENTVDQSNCVAGGDIVAGDKNR